MSDVIVPPDICLTHNLKQPKHVRMENVDSSTQASIGNIQAPASPTASLSAKSKKIERSCLLCHQRKIRCNKRSPCSNCTRADVVCCYPGPEKPGRRQPKFTISELAARVTRLERTIAAVSNDASDSTNKSSPDEAGDMSEKQSVADSSHSPEELLVQDGSSTRYINEALLSRVLEGERGLQSVMGSPRADSERGKMSSPLDIGGLFSGFNRSMQDAQSHHPSRWHATQLWQAFVNNVDPIVKVLHVPTTQATIYAAINNPSSIEEDLNALLFSIYFAATTSLTSRVAVSLLGYDKSRALNHYKQGLEQSLAGANILDTPSMRSLQAMTIYLACLRAYNGGRSGWTLNGLVLRSAQSIGLHRDGKNFNLPPFESEMRRRLWWYICAIDSRAAEDHGIALNGFDKSSDTRFPLNVNDSELSPNMQELPMEKAKWTEMSFSLTVIEATHVLQQFYQTPDTSLNVTSGESSKDEILNGLMTRLKDKYICDCNIPIQKATQLCGRLLGAKLRFLISPPWLDRSAVVNNASYANEDALVAACLILEMNIQLYSDDLMRGFRWYFETYVQYHPLTYVLWHLCVKPLGPSLDRAWKAVDESFEIVDHRDISCQLGSKWTVLQRLRDKALRIRHSCDTEGSVINIELEDPSRMKISTEGFENAPNYIPGGDENWDFNATNFDMPGFGDIDFSF
ncbi:hypothetical protein MMC07_007776 [Pseudocyphellaria aurata]|nr:hypothetical protein [Pseudocyphellaria aurata]